MATYSLHELLDEHTPSSLISDITVEYISKETRLNARRYLVDLMRDCGSYY